MLCIEVCLGCAKGAKLMMLSVPPGTTLAQAVIASGYLTQTQLAQHHFGIFGQRRLINTVLKDHDRVEIYFPLWIDPKMARAERAKKSRMRST